MAGVDVELIISNLIHSLCTASSDCHSMELYNELFHYIFIEVW